MHLENFKSGAFKPQYQYKSFSPTLVNQTWVWNDARINTLLERATQALGELNAFSFIVPDIDLFIQMHIAKEAETSSRIEGTQTTMEEALMEREYISPEKRDDWEEVQNYIKAMNTAIQRLKTLPLSNRLLQETHDILMQGVRGKHKTPGHFRTSQNWIGGTNLQNAVFIPPHPDELPLLMSDLEKFWHNEAIDVPHLIRVAISHYQFETIHPFQDGNGRIGRLLITLYLVNQGLLQRPSLYLSDYFERHKGVYYDALTAVRASNDLIHWIQFFLDAVIEMATRGKQTFQAILKLKSEIDEKVLTLGRRAEKARQLVMHLYKIPSINVSEVSALLGLAPKAVNQLIREFIHLGILQEKTGYKRNRIFTFADYLNLFT